MTSADKPYSLFDWVTCLDVNCEVLVSHIHRGHLVEILNDIPLCRKDEQ